MLSMADVDFDPDGLDYATANEDEESPHVVHRVGHSTTLMDEWPEDLENEPLISEDEDGVVRATRTLNYTVEEAVENMGFGKFQLRMFFICGLFAATDALEMLLLSVLSPVLRCDWMLSSFQVALITSVVFVGMFLGSAVWGTWSDKYGRLSIIMIAACWICYFGILTSFSPNYYWILIMRGLVGCGFGGAVQSFTLFSEYLPSKWRASVLIISNVMWAAGSIFEVTLAYNIIPTLGWRYLVGISALPTFISIFTLWQLPESARFLVAAGNKEKAVKVLKEASALNGKTLPPGELIETKKVPRGRWCDLFTPQYRRTTLQLWLLWFAAACTYYGIVLAQPEVLEFDANCGGGEKQADCHCNLLIKSDYISMIVATCGEFLSVPLNLFTIDTLGRKWTLFIDFGLAGLFFLLVQICTTKVWLTIFIFGVRVATSGVFNCVYIYTSEVFPTTVRSIGLGSCSAMARMGAMLTPIIAQVIMRESLVAALWIYAGLCFCSAISAVLLPIETRGREMPQTQKDHETTA